MARFEVIITATDAGFSTTMKTAQGQMDLTKLKITALNTAMAGMRMYAMVGAGAMAAMILPTVLASKAVQDFDSSIRRAVAVGGESYIGKMGEMADAVTDAAVKWGISSDDIASGVVELAKAGFDYNTTINDMMTGISQLAVIHEESFANISKIVTYAYTLWGDQAKNATELMDKMNMAANLSVLDIEELGSAFEYAGSTAMTSGMTIDQFLASIAALSDVASKSFQNVGTLFNRIFVQGTELEEKLGVTAGTFVREGVLNLDLFMKYLQDAPDKYDVIVKATELWGVRSTRVIQAMMAITSQYFDFLPQIGSAEGTLADQGEQMANSLKNTWQTLIETLMKPLKTEVVLTAMQEAIESLGDAIGKENIGAKIADIILAGTNFIKEFGPQLINTVTGFLNTATTLLPMLENIAQTFGRFLDVVSKIPSWVISLVAGLYLLNKVLPLSLFYTKAMGVGFVAQTVAIKTSGLSLAEYQAKLVATRAEQTATLASTTRLELSFLAWGTAIKLGVLASFVGLSVAMSTFMTSTSGFNKVIAGMVIALSILSMVLWNLAAAKEFLTYGPAAIVTTLAMVGTTAYLMMKNKEEMDKAAKNPTTLPPAGLAIGGRVIKPGKGYVHPGEIIVSEDEMAEVSRNYQVPMQYAHSVGGSVNVEGMGYVHKDEAIVSLEEEPVRDIATKEIKKRKPKLGKAKYIAEEGWTYLESKEVIIPKNKVQQLGDILGFWSPKQQTSILNNINIPTAKAPKVAISGPQTASIKLVTFPVLNSMVSQNTLKEVNEEKKEFGKQTILGTIRERLSERTAIKEREKEASTKSLIERLKSKSEYFNLLSSSKSIESSESETARLEKISSKSGTTLSTEKMISESNKSKTKDIKSVERDIAEYQKSLTERDISSIISKEFYNTMSEKEQSRKESVSIYQDKEQKYVSEYIQKINALTRLPSTTLPQKYQHAEGGEVQKEGWGYLHENEYIIPQKEMASVQNEIINTNSVEKIIRQNTNNTKIVSRVLNNNNQLWKETSDAIKTSAIITSSNQVTSTKENTEINRELIKTITKDSSAIKSNTLLLKKTSDIVKTNAITTSSNQNAISTLINKTVGASTSAIKPPASSEETQKETQETKDWLGKLLTSGDWITKALKSVGISAPSGLPNINIEKAKTERAIEDARWASGINRTWLPSASEPYAAPSVEPVSRTWQQMMSETDKTYTAAWTPDKEAIQSKADKFAESEWELITTESGLARMELKKQELNPPGTPWYEKKDEKFETEVSQFWNGLTRWAAEAGKDFDETKKDWGKKWDDFKANLMGSGKVAEDLIKSNLESVTNAAGSIVNSALNSLQSIWGGGKSAEKAAIAYIPPPEYIPPEANIAAGGKGARELARVSHAAGGFVEKEGWGYLHPNETIVPDVNMAQVKMPEFPSYPKISAPIQSTENNTNNYDNKIVNMYSIREDDLERILARNGRGK